MKNQQNFLRKTNWIDNCTGCVQLFVMKRIKQIGLKHCLNINNGNNKTWQHRNYTYSKKRKDSPFIIRGQYIKFYTDNNLFFL